VAPALSIVDRLKALESLHARGVITVDEYTARRLRLIDEV
jgi:hypothetical protein